MAPSAYGTCIRCRRRRRFICTNRFRVNANKHLIDVWLLFYCERCGAKTRVPVVARVPVSKIHQQDLDAFHRNDLQMAARVQWDITILRLAGLSIRD